jgi:uncharacterized hydrophobic protein (TIGR00271 family)
MNDRNWNFAHIIHRLIKPLSFDQRQIVIRDLSAAATSGFDFFLLVILSCCIATLGLITDSPAVIIGAMLLAPLMTPIIGIGLASITGDSDLLVNSLLAVLRGVLLAILLAALVALINTYLPFISLQELPQEITARMRPTPIDMVIALAGGIAAAYALTQPNLSATLPGVAIATALMPPLCTIGIGLALLRWEVASGAFLLFLTNAITIAFAAALVFFLRGFGSSMSGQSRRLPRSLLLSALLTFILLIPLSYYSIKFFRDAAENRFIQSVVTSEVQNLGSAELVEVDINRNGNALDMILTVRTNSQLKYQQVLALQEAIVEGINRPVALKINQVFAERLDPLIPPTPTMTPTVTNTYTPGPSPTATSTLTPSATNTPLPTATPTFTPTPANGKVIITPFPGMQMYQSPGGPVIGRLYLGQSIRILYGRETKYGLVWIEIEDEEGRIGWAPEIYIQPSIAKFTPTATLSKKNEGTDNLITPTPSVEDVAGQ